MAGFFSKGSEGSVKKRRSHEVNVFLGPESVLEGELTFHGQARLDGQFTGHIKGTGELLVGPGAKVSATIHADSVVISGHVIGDIQASDRIELRAPGRLSGNISAPLVVMDEGVLFEGHCTMAKEGGEGAKVMSLPSSATSA